MKALHSTESVPLAPGSGKSSLSTPSRPVSLSRTGWFPSVRDIGIAVLITTAWLSLVALGAAFWTAVIWLVVR
jgi:hypothetical protein